MKRSSSRTARHLVHFRKRTKLFHSTNDFHWLYCLKKGRAAMRWYCLVADPYPKKGTHTRQNMSTILKHFPGYHLLLGLYIAACYKRTSEQSNNRTIEQSNNRTINVTHALVGWVGHMHTIMKAIDDIDISLSAFVDGRQKNASSLSGS